MKVTREVSVCGKTASAILTHNSKDITMHMTAWCEHQFKPRSHANTTAKFAANINNSQKLEWFQLLQICTLNITIRLTFT